MVRNNFRVDEISGCGMAREKTFVQDKE